MTRYLIAAVVIVSALWVIYDVWMVRKKISTGSRVLWSVFALVFSVFTALFYFLSEKKK